MNTKVWLGISVLVNLLTIGWMISRQGAVGPGRDAAGPNETVPVESPVSIPVGIAKSDSATVVSGDSKGGGNLDQWLRSLRAAGVPERLIAEVASADFERHWQKRFQEIDRKYRDGDIDEAELSRFLHERDAEQESAMRIALGEEGYRRWDRERTLQEFNLASLKISEAEADALYELRKGLTQAQRETERGRYSGELAWSEVEVQVEKRAQEYESQVKALLGEERYLMAREVDDGSLGQLKRSLRTLNSSDEQIETMVAAQKRWNDKVAALNLQMRSDAIPPENYEEQMSLLQKSREDEFRALLGAEAYADLQKTQDDRYRTMKRYADQWGLSGDDVDRLYSTIRYYDTHIADYRERARATERQGQEVDWPVVQSTIQEYSRQVEDTLKQYLGQDRFEKLKKNDVFMVHE